MPYPYRYLAEWFEYLNDDCDYPKWSQYFIERLEGLGAGKKGLEIGCGSGAFCRALAKAGYAMSGADISCEMLSAAEKSARRENLKIDFFVADAAALRTPSRYDFLLAPNDVYNYLPPEKLPLAFRRAAKCLLPGGLFLFDISSEGKLCGKVADTISADDREDVTYLSFNRREGEKIVMDVTLFVKRKDGAFDRLDETHTQYIHREEEVLSALRAAGFALLSEEGHLGEEKEGSDRLNFICRKT